MPVIINLDPGAAGAQWREFQPGVRAKIKPYLRSLVRRILRDSTVLEPADTAGLEAAVRERVDPDLWDRNLYRGIIEEIDGLVDADGHPVTCTDDNTGAIIDAVCDQVEGFAAWAVAESQALAAQITAAREKTEVTLKNSKRSRDGKKAAPTA